MKIPLPNANLVSTLPVVLSISAAALIIWILDIPHYAMPLILGVIAGGLADLDNRLRGRIKDLGIVLAAFAATSLTVQLTLNHSAAYITAMLLMTFLLTYMGAAGLRYRTIAFGGLTVAIYTTLAYNAAQPWYANPLLILAGALLYGGGALIVQLAFPHRQVQENMAAAYAALADYIDAKACYFDPDDGDYGGRQQRLARANTALIQAFNQCRSTLYYRMRGQHRHPRTARMLRYYFAAQDIHERISSSHIDYRELAEKHEHSDLPYRFLHLIERQAAACRAIAAALHRNTAWPGDPRLDRDSDGLARALQYHLAQDPARRQLARLLDNLRSINYQLTHLDTAQEDNTDSTIAARQEPGLREILPALRRHLSFHSPAYRHAVRLSLVVLTCCLIVAALHLELGYWILLTAIFVCQPNYSATKSRVNQRVLGTILGVLIGSVAPLFTPTVATKLWLIIASTTLFFYYRNRKYSISTLFITVQAFTSFSLAGYDLTAAIPLRVIDTLIGVAISWTAVTYLWPDWRYLTLDNTARAAIKSDAAYLRHILAQLQAGGSDDVAYRSIRRVAHENAAQLGSTVSDISSEPRKYANQLDNAFNLLNLNYTLLAYISALGAYRNKTGLPAPAEQTHTAAEGAPAAGEREEQQSGAHHEPGASPVAAGQEQGADTDPLLTAYYRLGADIAGLLDRLDTLDAAAFRTQYTAIRAELDRLRPDENNPRERHSILRQQLLMISRIIEPCYHALHPPHKNQPGKHSRCKQD